MAEDERSARLGSSQVRQAKVARWAVRVCFAIVFALNVQCALQFVFDPASYAPAFELSGIPGEAAVRGIGIAFLMWNATYPAFIVFPERFACLGAVVLVQQLIGAVGETAVFFEVHAAHPLLGEAIARFMVFDIAGLVVMGASFALLCACRARCA